jgi:acetylornithine deacetylase/succinyl-diaminopimelate desuccinylase-like protein
MLKKGRFSSLFSFFISFFSLVASVQSQRLSAFEIRELASKKFPEAVRNLTAFLKLPNDGHFPDQVAENLVYSRAFFNDLNFETRVLSTEGAPLLFAQKEVGKKTKTVLFYLQIDGQPADASKWDQPDPFDPVFKKKRDKTEWVTLEVDSIGKKPDPEWRIFARSASDSKGPAMAFISALQILKAQKIKPAFNIKVIMDFQEEMGSPHLPKAVEMHKDLLNADFLLIMDGTRHLSNWPTLTYGARGIATATLRIFGPNYALHSGQYGNYAPNPVFEASRLVSSLKDENGKVTIPGFYDGISLSDKEKKILNSLPENEDSLKIRLGIHKPDKVGNTYQESLQYPSLNIRGLRAAWVGDEVRTLIPDEVIVEFDMRLVPESSGERLIGLLRKRIEDFEYHLVDSIPSEKDRQTFSKLASFK